MKYIIDSVFDLNMSVWHKQKCRIFYSVAQEPLVIVYKLPSLLSEWPYCFLYYGVRVTDILTVMSAVLVWSNIQCLCCTGLLLWCSIVLVSENIPWLFFNLCEVINHEEVEHLLFIFLHSNDQFPSAQESAEGCTTLATYDSSWLLQEICCLRWYQQ
jgi:hypothetical protein